MRESKHTPYPWFVVEMHHRKHSTANRYLIQSGEANICTLDVAGREPGRDEANAHLIAAAPDLLAALEECERDLAKAVAFMPRRYCNGADNQRCDELLATIRAAIAKAKGK